LESLRAAEGGKSGMIYVKSVLAGIVAVFVVSILILFAITAYMSIVYHIGGGSIGWDPVSVANPLTWLVNLAIFLGGFFWEFRRCRSK
jgi:hypothetical protein